jgi:diacylglycerol kinase (CTP)
MEAAEKLKSKADLHIARKFWHFLGVMSIIVIYHNVARVTGLKICLGFALLFTAFDLLRIKNEKINQIMLKVFGSLMRESERYAISGNTFLLLGTFVTIYVFDPEIAKLSLFFLATADPLASYIGVKYGKDKIVGNKSLQGSAAAFVSCMLVSAIYFYSKNIMVERIVIVSILAGLIGAASELICVGKLDDNLTLPIISSSFLFVLFSMFGAV